MGYPKNHPLIAGIFHNNNHLHLHPLTAGIFRYNNPLFRAYSLDFPQQQPSILIYYQLLAGMFHTKNHIFLGVPHFRKPPNSQGSHPHLLNAPGGQDLLDEAGTRLRNPG